MKQKIAFLYLNTGGGHVAPARALAKGLESLFPGEDETLLFNGFSDRMKISRFFFEDGYRVSSNYFEAGYVLFYRATEIPFNIRFGNYFVSIHGHRHLVRFLRDQGITKVVCLHEVLIIMARKAIDAVDPDIPLITMVTDPFTAHGLWFYERRMELVVFSEKLRKEAVERYGFSADHVHSFPFMLSDAFNRPYTGEERLAVRKRLGIDPDRKVLLIAGGGEGLKSADRIVSCFLKKKRPELLIVVCGRNRLLKMQVRGMVERKKADNVMIFPFISFMPDLLNIADCIVTKGGASTVMEVLAVQKPVIFSTFIRGQELGNVLYVIHNGAGWFIKKPAEILKQAERVFTDPALSERVAANCSRLGIRNGLKDVACFIHDFARAR